MSELTYLKWGSESFFVKKKGKYAKHRPTVMARKYVKNRELFRSEDRS